MSLAAATPLAAQGVEAVVGARVLEAVGKLRESLAQGPVNGRLLERVPGSYDFIPSDRALPVVTITNPDQVGSLAVGPEVRVRGQLDEQGRSLSLQSYTLAVPLDRAPASDAGSPTDAAVRASNAIVRRLNEAVRPGAQSVQSRVLSRTNPLGQATLDDVETIVDAYDTALAGGNAADVDRILARWSELRPTLSTVFSDGSEYKAIYEYQDNYAPWRYQRVYTDALSVVAIGEPGRDTSRCSGVLVAEDLVLTAGHCFSAPPTMKPQQLEVWFGYQQMPDGSRPPMERRRILRDPVAPVPARWQRLMRGEYGADLYDYAIVRFETPPGKPRTPAGAKPQCLRRATMHRSEAVYVVGYPQGKPVTVHDAGRVSFPFQILDGQPFKLLRMDVEADFKGRPERAQVMGEFDRSYTPVKEDGLDWRRFYDIRDHGHPRMGIIVDTFAGNSGGPVYDHDRNQCVVGIINRGMADVGAPYTPNWRQHERALPITAVLDDLERDPLTAPLVRDGKLEIVE